MSDTPTDLNQFRHRDTSAEALHNVREGLRLAGESPAAVDRIAGAWAAAKDRCDVSAPIAAEALPAARPVIEALQAGYRALSIELLQAYVQMDRAGLPLPGGPAPAATGACPVLHLVK